MPLALFHYIQGFLIIIEGNRHRCDSFHIYYRIRVSADGRKHGLINSLKHREYVTEKFFWLTMKVQAGDEE